MIAIVRLGAAHSVVFGGFAAKELAIRIRHTEPKVIISASCGIEPGKIVKYKPNVDEAICLAGGSVKSLVFRRDQCLADITEDDLVWQELSPMIVCGCAFHPAKEFEELIDKKQKKVGQE